MRLAQRLRMAGFKPSAPPSEYKYMGYASDANGVPNPPVGEWGEYGNSGSKVYATKATAPEDGTAVAINIRCINSSPASDNIYVVLYRDETLLGTAPLDDNPADSWSGYIEITAESGQSLSFSSGDVLRFGLSDPDYQPGEICNDEDGAELVNSNYTLDDFTDKPPSPVDSWKTSAENFDIGAILKYST